MEAAPAAPHLIWSACSLAWPLGATEGHSPFCLLKLVELHAGR